MNTSIIQFEAKPKKAILIWALGNETYTMAYVPYKHWHTPDNRIRIGTKFN